MNSLFKNNKGDTIVEVMIAILVLGAALGGALSISNKSIQNTQNSHENHQAQLYANQQAELLRQDYATHLANPGSTRSNYTSPAGGVCYPSCTKDIYTITVAPVATNSSNKVSSVAISPKTYSILVTWPGLGGNLGKVELIYGI